MTKELQYDKWQNTVVEANEIIRAKQDNLSLIEAKFVRYIISQVLTTDTELKTYQCKLSDLAKVLRMDRHNVYKEITVLCRDIMGKVIKIKNGTDKNGKQNYKMIHWVDTIEYKDNILTVKLAEELKPYVIELNRFFTSYAYEDIAELPTDNSIRLYELICSYKNMVFDKSQKSNFKIDERVEVSQFEFPFTIDYLRQYFSCEDKYPNTSSFISRIIDSSIKAIKKKMPWQKIDYRIVKINKKIEYVIFTIARKEYSDNERITTING